MSTVDLLVAEIGSTTTVVNAFAGVGTPTPKFIGQGQAPTTVLNGDVTIGVKNAVNDLENNLDIEGMDWKEMLATSSAAGGLKMTVHGLVYDMTVKAAEDAALGAGAVIKMVTAGKLRDSHLKRIKDKEPNIILLAGGVDYGEEETIIHNAKMLAQLDRNIPILYAGNIAIRDEIKDIFADTSFELLVVDNVYPEIDQFNIEPTRAMIQDAFEKHIIHAPGMDKIDEWVTGPIMPTPGAVMNGAKLLKEEIGDLIVFDVGGATTDLHSVTEGSEEIRDILTSPEPVAKRTVEGDLGVFVNADNVVNRIGKEKLSEELGSSIDQILEDRKPIPKDELEKEFIAKLTKEAVQTAVKRHAGTLKEIYGPSGRQMIASGKDLTRIKWVIGTGGALTRLAKNEEILKSIRRSKTRKKLFPTLNASVTIDEDYIMASLGVMGKEYPETAVNLLKQSLKIEEDMIKE
ncbi:GlmL-related ornithine degradation protein [Selenihalanaerobacter shriftii]|uniref:DNA mismatch repair protein MutL n=1 Tax=Selenihalanaerobacter shriftii TaxID=142842 RepID=A0A1T4NDM4_9FIRM|nr:GlmL-related ornithine degradation protein [Selenihalanaerobacter shriftii]SJZ77087.1 conserved hypothetical protein [Selenihalanaerobacter shriftii]